MAFITIQGVDHYYEWVTPYHNIPDTRKPTIVFLHGWAGSARYWYRTAQALQSQFNCLLYDLRGFGRSPLPDNAAPHSLRDYRLESYAVDLVDLLDALGLDQVYLNAHSTGASIATIFIHRYPQRVKKAILTCSGIFEYQEFAFKAFHFVSQYVVKFRPQWFLSIPQLDRFFMARFLHKAIDAQERKAFLADFLQAEESAAMGTIYTAVSKEAAETMPQVFSEITVPTLLISGQYDIIIPAPMGKNAADLNDRITYSCLSNTAHFPMLEDPQTYFDRIQAFLIESDI
jgi:proline iminopeptidase